MSGFGKASRRQVLAGLAGAGAMTGAAGASAAAGWSHETDVLVVGSGAGAMSTAIAVIRAGGRATLVEKAAATGGTSAKSAGAYWIPNSHLMRARGMTDPRPEAIRYMASDSYPALYREDLPDLGVGADRLALIEAYYDNAAAVIEDLERAGALKGRIIEVADYVDHTPLDRVPRHRAIVPLRPDGQIGRGLELVRQLKAWLTAHQAPILLEHEVTDVIRNRAGQVVGLEAQTPGGPVRLRARRGVVFATGGYSQNPRLLQTFIRGPVHGACSTPSAQGDFIHIGVRAGAMLGNMTGAWFSEVVLEPALTSPSVAVTMEFPPGDSMIFVNKYGRRVVNEKRNYNVRGRAHFVFDEVENEYPNDLLFMVFDQRSRDLFAGDMHMPAPGADEDYLISAPDLPRLGAAIQARLDRLRPNLGARALSPGFVETLTAQVARFNEGARKGVDPDFQRGRYPYDLDWHRNIDSVERTDTRWPANPGPNYTVYPIADRGPYHAIILGAGMLDTNGGPVINARAQVVDTRGKAIPGLYGAGNCIAAPGGGGYWGAGATLGPAMTFGTIAGRNAVAEPLKEA